ncbi:ParB N-terminal domain-containing protein [Microbispora amethystogenes]|uniref:ParB/RepB/Spo0J family partition protein n=1 Tax=Microbispora amethystogenes TaxID=1427754 RepID=UPI00340A8F02
MGSRARPGGSETHVVAVDALMPGFSPRHVEDRAHAQRLAQTETPLPPILVHRDTMRVIDGMHRLRAARLNGRRHIEVTFFDGSEEDAFVRAVEENVAHGLPLSLADRKDAALRILAAYPQWSDRAIATRTGLAAKTVGALRDCSSGETPRSNTRLGSDGRVRPLSATEGRKRAAEAISELPETSLREIAKIAGVSLGTAHDVRARLRRGDAPVPAGRRGGGRRGQEPSRPTAGAGGRAVRAATARDNSALLRRLMRDPALRRTDPGRQLLRLLQGRSIAVEDWARLVDAVPAHCAEAVAEVARRCAASWAEFARELERRHIAERDPAAE